MPRIITTTCFCLLASLAMAQINSDSLEALQRRIDSSSKAFKAYNDSMTKRAMEYNDSIMMAPSLEQMDRNFESFMAERQRQEEKQRRNSYIKIAFGLAGFGLLIFSFVRNRKKKKEEEARRGNIDGKGQTGPGIGN